jgi:hypothetical protein
MDTPAILLNLYGVPIPEDYDGQVLNDLMPLTPGQKHAVFQPGDENGTWSGGEVLSEQESEELTSHLRALGYLD